MEQNFSCEPLCYTASPLWHAVEISMKNNPFSFFLDQLEQKLPDSLRPMPGEIRAAARAMMDERLAKLDWVPRSEFEAQERLLAVAEAQLDKQISSS